MSRTVSRRDALLGGAAMTHAVLGCSALGCSVLGCRTARTIPTCTDDKGLAPQAIQARTALAYQDRATTPDRACERCVQWVEAKADGQCGGCKVLAGPISPAGTCKAFALRS